MAVLWWHRTAATASVYLMVDDPSRALSLGGGMRWAAMGHAAAAAAPITTAAYVAADTIVTRSGCQ